MQCPRGEWRRFSEIGMPHVMIQAHRLLPSFFPQHQPNVVIVSMDDTRSIPYNPGRSGIRQMSEKDASSSVTYFTFSHPFIQLLATERLAKVISTEATICLANK
jgi:hypothetical protein